MKRYSKIIWKLYAIIFTLMAFSHLIALLHQDLELYIFYHILIAWSSFFKFHYFLAILKSALTILCLYPLWLYAFNKKTKYQSFWQWILILRIVLDIYGNYYEFVLIKSSFYMMLAYGLSLTGAFILPSLPSYIAHYLFAFSRNKIKYKE